MRVIILMITSSVSSAFNYTFHGKLIIINLIGSFFSFMHAFKLEWRWKKVLQPLGNLFSSVDYQVI